MIIQTQALKEVPEMDEGQHELHPSLQAHIHMMHIEVARVSAKQASDCGSQTGPDWKGSPRNVWAKVPSFPPV